MLREPLTVLWPVPSLPGVTEGGFLIGDMAGRFEFVPPGFLVATRRVVCFTRAHRFSSGWRPFFLPYPVSCSPEDGGDSQFTLRYDVLRPQSIGIGGWDRSVRVVYHPRERRWWVAKENRRAP